MGSGKKQKVGIDYFFGLVLVPLRKHDAVLEIEMNDKSVWTGRVKNGRISINKPDAFGGDEREGGFVGDIDIQDGRVTQLANDYFAAAKGGLTSAMRGVVSFVYRQPKIGSNTARLPSIRTKHLNVTDIHKGWEVGTAVVNSEVTVKDKQIFIMIEGSHLVSLTGLGAARAATISLLTDLIGTGNKNDIRIVWSNRTSSMPSIERFNCTDQDYQDIIDFLNAQEKDTFALGAPDIDLSTAPAFFNQGVTAEFESNLIGRFPEANGSNASGKSRHIVFLTASTQSQQEIDDANAVIASLSPISVQGISIFDTGNEFGATTSLEQLDNSGSDIIEAADTATATEALKFQFLTWADMNPAHIIRSFWTDPARGGAVAEADIGDSFAVEAQRYFDEGMGFSPKFRGLDLADSDRSDIERHAECVSFRSTATGKIELISIRDNYNVADLIVLDEDIVTDWSGLSRPRLSEVPNQLTVNYTRRDGKSGSVTRTNAAGVRRRGQVVKAAAIDYPACTTEELATRLCLRDLRTVTTDILSGTIPLRYLPQGIGPGSVVVVNCPPLNYNNIVMRVSEARVGQSGDAQAWLTLAEDNFATTQVVTLPERVFDDPSAPVPVENRLVTEASYFQGVFELGQATLDAELEAEPDLGRLVATGAKSNSYQLDATLATSTGGDWVDEGLVDFEPYGVLINGLSRDPTVTTFLVTYNITLTEIAAGELARLGSEIIRIDDLADQGDGTVLVTVGRGCLDGAIENHSAGDVFILSSVVDALETNFLAGQSVSVKMLSRTGSGAQTLNDAETDVVTFASRATRPYPVGQFKVDGSYTPAQAPSSVAATWVHRDRLTQTTPDVADHDDPSIGPEEGVFYTPFVRAYAGHADYFEPADYFERKDFFADVSTPTKTALLEGVLSPVDATSYTFAGEDILEPDYFGPADYFSRTDFFGDGVLQSDTALLAVGVRTSRGTDPQYDNWEEPEIRFTPLAAPFLEISNEFVE